MIIVNTPHNPVGKVFTRQELEQIAALSIEHNLLVMSDEVVCDYFLFKKLTMIHFRPSTTAFCLITRNMSGSPPFLACGSAQSQLALPAVSNSLFHGLALPLSVFPESFAATGWRVGWLIGPQSIISPTLAATTRIVFCTNSPLQEAAAAGLELAPQYKFFETQTREYDDRRHVMVDTFDKLGMKYTMPEGSYFILLVGSASSFASITLLTWLCVLQGYIRREIPGRLPFP